MSRSKHSYEGNARRSAKQHQSHKDFRCVNCRQIISVDTPGSSHRNHCPLCLWSQHVDENPGDRRSSCRGKMEPISVWVKDSGEWSIVHRCRSCGATKTNRIAGDDNAFALMSLASKAIASPPFPLDKL